jgi:hypothetical protein
VSEDALERRILCLLPGALSPGHVGIPESTLAGIVGLSEEKVLASLLRMEHARLVARRSCGWGMLI